MGIGKRLEYMAFTKLKIAAVAPMPSASVVMAMAVPPGYTATAARHNAGPAIVA